MARMSCMVSDYLDYRKDNRENVDIDYIRENCEMYGYLLSVYEAYNEDNVVSCIVCDITFTDGSELHLEYDMTGTIMRTNSPY